jgi:hypothetical protein
MFVLEPLTQSPNKRSPLAAITGCVVLDIGWRKIDMTTSP